MSEAAGSRWGPDGVRPESSASTTSPVCQEKIPSEVGTCPDCRNRLCGEEGHASSYGAYPRAQMWGHPAASAIRTLRVPSEDERKTNNKDHLIQVLKIFYRYATSGLCSRINYFKTLYTILCGVCVCVLHVYISTLSWGRTSGVILCHCPCCVALSLLLQPA